MGVAGVASHVIRPPRHDGDNRIVVRWTVRELPLGTGANNERNVDALTMNGNNPNGVPCCKENNSPLPRRRGLGRHRPRHRIRLGVIRTGGYGTRDGKGRNAGRYRMRDGTRGENGHGMIDQLGGAAKRSQLVLT